MLFSVERGYASAIPGSGVEAWEGCGCFGGGVEVEVREGCCCFGGEAEVVVIGSAGMGVISAPTSSPSFEPPMEGGGGGGWACSGDCSGVSSVLTDCKSCPIMLCPCHSAFNKALDASLAPVDHLRSEVASCRLF